MKLYVLLSVVLAELSVVNLLPCASKQFPQGTVCVCNATYCDTLEDVEPSGNSEFILVSSGKDGPRFHVSKGQFLDPSSSRSTDDESDTSTVDDDESDTSTVDDGERDTSTIDSDENRSIWDRVIGTFKKMAPHHSRMSSNHLVDKDARIKVNRAKTYQKIIGFGGGFNGAVSYNLDKLSQELQNQVYKSYYSKSKGIGYTMMRMSIGGRDFDLEPWAYNEYPINDASLSNFTALDSRDLRKIQQIQQLKAAAEIDDIKYYGNAWSPPKWMKSNNDWTGPSALKPEYYQTWADYHLKWLELMDANGMPFWGISTGMEPSGGVSLIALANFVSLGWAPEFQAQWIAENFGPTLRNSKFKDIIIMGPEDNRFTIPYWLENMEKTDPRSISYLDGVSVIWYFDQYFSVHRLDETHSKFKGKILFNTESSFAHKPALGYWEHAEKYIDAYMQDFQHWLNGWIDCNLILDEDGGPNYAYDIADGPVIRSADGSEIYKQPSFYAIGHFSRFLVPDSVRVESSSKGSPLKTVAFKRPDGSIALIVHNSKTYPVKLEIEDSVRGKIQVKLPQKSVHTIVYN